MTKVLYNGVTIDLPNHIDDSEKEADIFNLDENIEATKEFNINDISNYDINIEEIEKTIDLTKEGDENNEE